jgi:hypothetical protein
LESADMTKDEALTLALEALEADELDMVDDGSGNMVFRKEQAITAIKEALAQPVQPEQEPVDCYGYAARLATSIWKQHYQKTAPQWQVLDDLIGVLTQIDNMAAGLISTPLPVQPDQSVAGYCKKIAELIAERDSLRAALAQSVQPEREPNNTRPCRSCGGTGDRETGIPESPIATCKPCKGTGQIAIAAQPPLPVQERNSCPRCGKRTADPTMIHTCTPPIAADPQAFYGFPHGPVSTPNAGGKCVTAGETAPKEST